MLINVDNGGTFTDFWTFDTDRKVRVKTRTTPHDLSECLFEGLRLLSEDIYRKADIGRLLAETKYIRYSTTQGTNALVQRKGPRIGLILSSKSVFEEMFGGDEQSELLKTLIGSRVEEIEPEVLKGADPSDEAAGDRVMQVVNNLTASGANRIVISLGSPEAEQSLQRFAAARFPKHLLGTVPILKTSDVTADANQARATWTAVFNAFLHPAIERFLYNTDNRLKAMNLSAPLLVFRNDGLAGRVAKTPAIKTYGSGPEGGVYGAAALAHRYDYDHLVTIDVGGTTTDFAVIEKGSPSRHLFGKIESVEISMPMSELRSIGVGGGSIIKIENGAIKVGPDSVGAAPGPACFGYGGTQATITDVKLLKGVIDPDRYFGGRMSLDADRAANALQRNIAEPLGIDLESAIDMTEDAWVGAIAEQLRGYVLEDTVLGAFGGAGPFSICAIADAVAIHKIIVPAAAAVFSASGIGESDIGHRYDDMLSGPDDPDAAAERVSALLARARQDMFAEGFELADCKLEWTLRDADGKKTHLAGNDVAAALGKLKPGISVLDLTVSHAIRYDRRDTARNGSGNGAARMATRTVRFRAGKERDVPVHAVDALAPGTAGRGPAIIEDAYFTLPVPDGWSFAVTDAGDIELKRK